MMVNHTHSNKSKQAEDILPICFSGEAHALKLHQIMPTHSSSQHTLRTFQTSYTTALLFQNYSFPVPYNPMTFRFQ
jgi:hypothetical protein